MNTQINDTSDDALPFCIIMQRRKKIATFASFIEILLKNTLKKQQFISENIIIYISLFTLVKHINKFHARTN